MAHKKAGGSTRNGRVEFYVGGPRNRKQVRIVTA